MPTPVPFTAQYERFLVAEQGATGRLVGFYSQTRIELADFLAHPPVALTASEQAFYGALQDEVVRLSQQATIAGGSWIADSIPTAFVEGAAQHAPGIAFNVVHDQAARALSSYTLDQITKMNAGMRAVVQQQIGVGLLEGATREVVSQRILATGLTNIPHWRSVEERAAVIGRTELMRAYNHGNLTGIRDTGAAAVEWITGADERVCPICGPRHGKIFRIDGARPGDEREAIAWDRLPVLQAPPAHPRCRCTVRASYRYGGDVTKPEPLPGGVIDRTPTPKGAAIPSPEDEFEQRIADLKHNFPTDAGYWHDVSFDEARLRKVADTLTDSDSVGYFMRSRYGADFEFSAREFTDVWQAEADMRYYVLRGIDRYRDVFPRNVDSSSYFKKIFFGTPRDMSRDALADCSTQGAVRLSLTRLRPYLKRQLRGGADINGVEEVMVHELGHALHNRFGMLYAQGRGAYGTWGTRAAELGGGYASENAAIEALWKEYASIRRKTKGVWFGGIDTAEAHARDLRDRIAAYERGLAEWDSLPLSGDLGRIWEPGTGFVSKPSRTLTYKIERFDNDGRGASIGFVTATENFVDPVQIQNALGGLRFSLAEKEKELALLRKGVDQYPTDYAQKNMREDFAESSMLYMLNPDHLKRSSPLRFAFMKKLFSMAS